MKRDYQCIPGRGNSGVKVQGRNVLFRDSRKDKMIWEQRQRMLGGKAGEVNRRRYKLLCGLLC